MSQIELHDVALRYFTAKQETEALRSINLTVEAGEFVAIVGPSGCGKSTLLSLISGMMSPTSGEVRLCGEPATKSFRQVGYMLQHDYLFEWRDVLKNVLLAAEVRGMDMLVARERAITLLNRYGLEGFSSHNPKQLSGGMRQRVALIRTLVVEPAVLLLDEPFSALDFQTRLALSDEIATILREQKKTVVLVTHDISEAVSMADRVVVLSNRPSTVKADFRMNYAGERPSPLAARQRTEYNEYFQAIWEELEHHVRVSK